MKKNRLIWAAVAAVLILFCIFAIIVERKNQDALQSVSASGVSGHPTILIDAGHGGVDGGTVAKDGTVEKGINLRGLHRNLAGETLLGELVCNEAISAEAGNYFPHDGV